MTNKELRAKALSLIEEGYKIYQQLDEADQVLFFEELALLTNQAPDMSGKAIPADPNDIVYEKIETNDK